MSEDYSLKDVIIRLDGIDARLDKQDAKIEKLTEKVNELDVNVGELRGAVNVLVSNSSNYATHAEIQAIAESINHLAARYDAQMQATRDFVYWAFSLLGLLVIFAPAVRTFLESFAGRLNSPRKKKIRNKEVENNA